MTNGPFERAVHLLSGRVKEVQGEAVPAHPVHDGAGHDGAGHDNPGHDNPGHDNAARPDAARAAASLGAALGIAEGSAISWMTEGACIERQDVDWFPSEGESGEDAKAVCRVCPVTQSCLAHALSRHEYGVWGGTTERERRVLRSYIASREPGRSGYLHGV